MSLVYAELGGPDVLNTLSKLIDEGHSSQRTAAWFHVGFVAAYLLSAIFHALSAHRHFKDAAEKKRGLTGSKT